MSKSFLSAILIVFAALNLLAQEQLQKQLFKAGSWEIAFTGDIGSNSSTYKASLSYQGNEYSDEYSDDAKYFQLHFLPAIFITQGLSIEPEFDFLFMEHEKPSYSIIPNLSYTYRLPSTPGLAVFARIGYGLSNSYVIFNMMERASDKLDISVFNAGGGLKFLFSESVAIRTEINYRSSSYDKEETQYAGTYKFESTATQTRLLLGLSILL